MKLLYIGDSARADDNPAYLSMLARMPALAGHSISTSFKPRETATEVSLLAKKHGIDAVICSQKSLLVKALHNLPDFVPSRKEITCDSYAGSWIDLPQDVPMLVINHLDRLQTVPSEKFVLDRFLSKITKPAKWWKQTEFKWKQVHEHTADEALAAIAAADLIAVDIETPGDDERSITCVNYTTYSFLTGTSQGYVVHFASEWAWRFCRTANASAPAKILQNGLYDSAYFLRWGCPLHNWLWDTLVLMHCWYSELPKSLDFLAAFALRKQRFWKEDGKTGSLEDLFRYNALDGWATINSFLALIQEIPEWAMKNYLQEFPMVFPALNANMEGVRIDVEKFREVRKQKDAEAESKLERVRNWLGEPTFNPRSPQQMQQLFKLLGCGHLPDTAKASMLKARAASPLNDLILGEIVEYKEAAKLISSYLDESKLWNGRWFYAIDPAGTDTGRAACKASAFWCGNSIQTIPRGDTLKQCFLADDGWLLAEPDKAQSEARCVGYMSGEQRLIDLVESTHDYHAWNAEQFFGVPYSEIYDEARGKTLNKELRDLSKRTNHGANYNMGGRVMLDTMGPKAVAKAKSVLKLPARWSLVQVCDYLLEQYAKTYPGVKLDFYNHIIATIEATSKLVSPLGWTRYFFAKPSRKNKPALNAAVAHGPQNLSVSIINREWYAVWRSSVYGELRGKVRIKAQIHDSILFQYKGSETPAQVHALMQTPVPVTDPHGITRTMLIRTDMSCGAERWSALK